MLFFRIDVQCLIIIAVTRQSDMHISMSVTFPSFEPSVQFITSLSHSSEKVVSITVAILSLKRSFLLYRNSVYYILKGMFL